MKFALQYLVSAMVLGAVVWFGIPEVKARAAGNGGEGRPPAETSAPARVPAPDVEGRREAAPAAGRVREPAPTTEPLRPAPSAVAASSLDPAPATGAQESVSPPPAPEYEPGQEPRQPDYDGPRYDWGVLAREAQSFSLEGQPRVKLPGGTVVEKMSERQAKTGDTMLICRIRNNRRWQEGFVFHAADVVQFQGPFAFAPKKPSDQVIDYFTKLDQRERRMAAIREEHLRKNPNFATYQEAARTYKEFQDTAKDLTARRDKAVGAERSRLMRELETMKSKEPRLRAEFEKAEIAYKQWKNQHGDGSEAINDDPLVRKLDGEIDELYFIVADMVPGL